MSALPVSALPVAGAPVPGHHPAPIAPAGPEPRPDAGPGRHARWTLVVVCAAIFMLLLDVTVVSVALGELQRDLSAGLEDLQWVVDSYTLALAGGILTAATMGDRLGRRRVFAAGLVVFSAASLGCAVAPDVVVLDLARAVQGIGAAMLFGTALPLLGAAFPDPAGRARAIGAFGAAMSAATAVGPLVGGLLVDGPGWRWIFLLNAPIGIAALLATAHVRESRSEAPRGTDHSGAVLLTASLLALLGALVRGDREGWDSPLILGALAASVLLLAGFVVRERRAAAPMLDLALLARPAFAGLAVQAFALTATLVAATFYLALHLQTTLGFSPTGTGLRLLPLTLASFVAAPGTAALLRRTGTAPLVVGGLLLAAAGMLMIAQFGAGSDWTVMVPGLVVAGLGLGTGLAASSSAALASVELRRAGMATGTVNTLRQVGTAAGVAALGAIYEHRAGQVALPATLPPSVRDRVAEAVASGAGVRVVEGLPAGVPAPVRAAVASAARQASTDALVGVLVWGELAALVACALSGTLLVVAAARRRADAG